MRGKRVVSLALLVAGLAALAVEPAAAQSTADSTTEKLLWDLNNQLMYIALPITLLVEGILFYTVWKFRKNESPLPTKENRRLEITWTVATAIILLFVGVASYLTLSSAFVTAAAPDAGNDLVDDDEEIMEVQVTAQKYFWTYDYPEQNVSTSDTMVLPANEPVRLNITSRDWLHAFHVPGLGLKQDAFPGQSNYIVTNVTSTGEYQLYCAEYCGVGHSQMLGSVDVRTQDDFQTWVEQNDPEPAANATAANATATNAVAG
jgi:cytochrome c oxidase subunit 2